MRKIVFIISLVIILITLTSCSKSTNSNNSSPSNSSSLTKSNIADINLDKYRTSGNTIYITQSLVLKNVSSYSNLKVSVKGTYKIKVVFTDGSYYSTTLSSYANFNNSLTATNQVYINSNKTVYDVESISASYSIQSISGTIK